MSQFNISQSTEINRANRRASLEKAREIGEMIADGRLRESDLHSGIAQEADDFSPTKIYYTFMAGVFAIMPAVVVHLAVPTALIYSTYKAGTATVSFIGKIVDGAKGLLSSVVPGGGMVYSALHGLGILDGPAGRLRDGDPEQSKALLLGLVPSFAQGTVAGILSSMDVTAAAGPRASSSGSTSSGSVPVLAANTPAVARQTNDYVGDIIKIASSVLRGNTGADVANGIAGIIGSVLSDGPAANAVSVAQEKGMRIGIAPNTTMGHIDAIVRAAGSISDGPVYDEGEQDEDTVDDIMGDVFGREDDGN